MKKNRRKKRKNRKKREREKEKETREKERENKRVIKIKCCSKCNKICTSFKLRYEGRMRDIYHLYAQNGCFNENSWIIYGKLDADKIVDNLCYICKKIN